MGGKNGILWVAGAGCKRFKYLTGGGGAAARGRTRGWGFEVPLRPPPRCPPTAGFEFFEASAKDNINVKQTFERLVDIICEKMSESLDTADPAVTGAKQGPQLTDQQAPPHQDCAC